MTLVESLINDEARKNAQKDGRFVPSSKDHMNATIEVCSGSSSEVDEIKRAVEAAKRG